MGKGKPKKKKISKRGFHSGGNVQNKYTTANLFEPGRLSKYEAIQEFNKLSSQDKLNIRRAWESLEKQRKIILQDVSKEEREQYYFNSVLVDSHIVATEYNTDPVLVLMCIMK